MRLFFFLLRYAFRYLKFFRRARTRYDVHSPFVAEFIAHTIEDERWFYIFDQVELFRERLALNDDAIEIVDYGAGSQLGNPDRKTVRRIAGSSAISAAAGHLLFRIVNFLQPRTILELGTSLGISAMYQLAARRSADLTTIEGNPELAALARTHLKAVGMGQARVLEGRFGGWLPRLVEEGAKVDFFYFDGDHRYEPTVRYFEQCLALTHPDSVFCIGDIYWSAEMEKCWRHLKRHPRVRLSIDLFHFGLLFLRSEQREKEDFTLIAGRWKPWRMGFWGR